MSSVDLNGFPAEVVQNIFQWLPPSQLGSLTITKYLYSVASSDALWQRLCLARKITPLEGRTFKQAFVEYSEGFYCYFETLFTAKGVSLPESTVEKKEAIGQKVQELERLPNLLDEAIVNEKPAIEVHYLIEAGALDRSTEKERVLILAIAHHYPLETIELLVEKGAPVTDDVIRDFLLLHKEPPQALLKMFLEKFIESNQFFSFTLFELAICRTAPEDCIFLIIKHSQVDLRYLKLALLLNASDGVITRLVEKSKLLSLDLLKENEFANRSDLFFRLYAQSTLPFPPEFKKAFVKHLNVGLITRETFHAVVNAMVVAGVKFSVEEMMTAAAGHEMFIAEALKRIVAECEVNPVALLKATFLPPQGEIELQRLLAAGIQVDESVQFGALLFPLRPEMVELLAPHIDFDEMRKMLLNQFEPFLGPLQKIHQEGDLNDKERVWIKAKIKWVSHLLSQLRQETADLDLAHRSQFYRYITQDLHEHFVAFYEGVLVKGESKFPFLYPLVKSEVLKAGHILLSVAITLKKPTSCFATFLKAGAMLNDIDGLILAAQLQLPSETIGLLISALVNIDVVKYAPQLRFLRSILSFEHFSILIKCCKSIPQDLIKDCILDKDQTVLQALIDAGARINLKALKFAIKIKIDADLFEILLNAAAPGIFLETLLHVAQEPHLHNEDIIRLIEAKLGV